MEIVQAGFAALRTAGPTVAASLCTSTEWWVQAYLLLKLRLIDAGLKLYLVSLSGGQWVYSSQTGLSFACQSCLRAAWDPLSIVSHQV